MPYLIGPMGLTAVKDSDGQPLDLAPHEAAIYATAGVCPDGCHWERVANTYGDGMPGEIPTDAPAAVFVPGQEFPELEAESHADEGE